MRPIQYETSSLETLFARQRIATLPELKGALGTDVYITVLRKLRPLRYLCSYSHGGRFYTLERLAQFDEHGLFRVGSACFSRLGSLVDTAAHWVNESAAGYYVAELNRELAVNTKDALRLLARHRRVVREEIAGYLYCALDPQIRQAQLIRRRQPIAPPPPPGAGATLSDEAKAALLLFFSTLNEHQRRLYAGMESVRLGRGGDRWIAQITGLDVHTVSRGRCELLAQDLALERIRGRGGGRPAVEKKRPR
jgi:hypothetical protein